MMDYSTHDFEKQVLGLILSTYGAIDQAQTLLPDGTPFAGPDEKKVYEALLALRKAGGEVDIMNAAQYLTTHVGKQCSLNVPWLVLLISYTEAAKASTFGLTYKCQVLWREYAQRESGRIGSLLMQKSLDRSSDPFEGIEEAVSHLNAINARISSLAETPFIDELQQAADDARTAYEGGGVGGLSTGLADIDKILKGLQEATLTILAARPAMGKTAEACQIAYNVAVEQGKGVAFFSLEMNAKQVARRFLAIDTGIRNAEMAAGQNRHNEPIDFEALDASVKKQGKAPLFVYDKLRTLPQIRAKCLQLAAKGEIETIIIDYLQLVKTGTKLDNNHYDRVTEVSRELKEISIVTGLPVIALAQLSREVEKRTDKRPMLSDLKESGAIEQDADNVIFLYRPAYYSAKDENGYPVDERLLLNIVAKNRNGSTHNDEEAISLNYELATNRIKDYINNQL